MVERRDIGIGLLFVAVAAGGTALFVSRTQWTHKPPPHPGEGIIPAVIDTDGCKVPTYPDASLAAGEEGSTLLDMLVDVDGKVVDSKVIGSSGFPRLDQAALEALKLCHFTPETVDGERVLSWNPLRYTWRIVDPKPPAPPPPAPPPIPPKKAVPPPKK
jgi:TonB family protein